MNMLSGEIREARKEQERRSEQRGMFSIYM
jgi:hypothetical protein